MRSQIKKSKLTVKIAADDIVATDCGIYIALVDVLAVVDAVAHEASIANALGIEHLNLSFFSRQK